MTRLEQEGRCGYCVGVRVDWRTEGFNLATSGHAVKICPCCGQYGQRLFEEPCKRDHTSHAEVSR